MTNKADMYARLDRALKQRGYTGPSHGPWLRQLEPGIWARVGAGWLEEATEHVREAVNALDARDDPAAEAYRRFAERVERWVAP